MSYRIVHCDERGVRLRRTNTSNALSALGVLFGLLFGTIGGGMALAGHGETVYTGYAFLLGALLFTVGPALLIRQRAIMDPRELIFDNQSALIAVLQRGPNDALRGFLPYDEVEGFAVRKDSVSSAGDSTTLTQYVYVVTLRGKGGGEWDLLSYSSEETALANCALLTGAVQLNKRCAALPEPVLPSHFRVESDSSLTALRWRNSFPGPMLLFILLFFGTYFGLMYFFNKLRPIKPDESGWHQKIMLGAGLFIFVAVLWNLLRSVLDSQRIRLAADEFILETLNASGEARSSKSLRTAEILGVRFDFGDRSGAGGLQVYTAESQTAMSHVRNEGFSFGALIADLKAAARSSIRIDVGMLTMAERLNIENYLNRALRKLHAGAGAAQAGPRPPFPGSAWWENQTSFSGGQAGGIGDGILGRLWSNGYVGVLGIILGPLPLIAMLFGTLALRGAGVASLIIKGAMILEVVSCLVALLIASRLLRARTALIRAGLAAACAVLVLAQFLRPGAGPALWPGLLLIPFLIAAGAALLNLPIEES